MSAAPEVVEGTWEEISLQSARFNGHRLRVTILPDEEPAAASVPFAPTGRYAARMRAALAEQTEPATPEEIAQAEREMEELIENLNENRRRDGAEPIF